MKKKKSQSEIIQQLTDRELNFHLIYTQFALLTISVISGIFLFKDLSTFFELIRFDSSIYSMGISSGAAVVLLDMLLMKWVPGHYYHDGGINERIFKRRSFSGIFFLTLLIAFSEEILFRGIIQTHFGWIAASLIFAIVHIRYWGHWFLIVNILILSFWIGGIYEYSHHNLLTVIVMHFVIDFFSGLLIKYKRDR
ncbi:CPBP family intramembrane glutamic endopeptidase [Heyndrickxia acidicola]|uniref:Type II CAAX endopeptidase family protein n=1 Tax=Heyndrickxia acidicola TaxID=209389 RepID=A0ABU6MJP9_9BACI|nr:type II CAAX endopeptidase family protein [Heyndrickxia acidicola]MED1204908.1 type II CAAX endopeptidase family protein [Heyndrickxia acidicola]